MGDPGLDQKGMAGPGNRERVYAVIEFDEPKQRNGSDESVVRAKNACLVKSISMHGRTTTTAQNVACSSRFNEEKQSGSRQKLFKRRKEGEGGRYVTCR